MARAPRDRAPSQNAYRGAVGATRTAFIHVSLPGPRPGGEIVAHQVYVAVDVVADPDLGQRLLSDDADHGLNVLEDGAGGLVPLSVPVIYHDPAAEIFALVAGPHDRHRELELHGKLLSELAADASASVPAYVREAPVVFGAAGLRAYLEERAERSLVSHRAADLERERITERRKAELAGREAEVDRRAGAVSDRARELDRRASELDGREATIAAREAEVEGQEADLARRQHEIEAADAELARRWKELEAARAELVARGDALDHARTSPVRVMRTEAAPEPPRPARISEPMPAVVVIPPRVNRASEPPAAAPPPTSRPAVVVPPLEAPAPPAPAAEPAPRGRASAPLHAVEVQAEPTTIASTDELADPSVPVDIETTNPFDLIEPVPVEPLPASADPLTTVTVDVPAPGATPPRFRAGEPDGRVALEDGAARVWLRVPADSVAALAHGPLDVRLQLHRPPEHAVITLTIGTPHAVRGLGEPHRVVVVVDPTADGDRRWLARLEQEFVLDVELWSGEHLVRRVRLEAPLADNARFIARAASDHQRGLPGGATALAAAVASILAAEHDLLGLQHPEHGELRIDKLEGLATANQVRRALAIARRFSRPVREDYLVTVRGFPLTRWTALRKAVLARAIACGLWMGPDLAQTAIALGLARSPADLWLKLDQGFTALLADAAANDLDPDAIEDNRAALTQEAASLGLTGGGGVVASDGDAFASGMIAPKTSRPPLEKAPLAELIHLLDDRARRLDAAIELCARRDPAAIRPVMAAVRRMSRAEAVRVLGSMVKFGPAAAPALTAGLASSKAFLRHGCALALALLRSEEGTEAVIDVLLSEPTEIWREIARAVGQVGPAALMPLAARLGRMGDRASASTRERMAWAMAHIAVRGGKAAVETLASGTSPVAPVAKMAIERQVAAAQDDVALRDGPARDVTVNRAFSRRFLEAAGGGAPGAALAGADASGPTELLDDADLLVDLDEDLVTGEAAELDDDDLLPG